MVYNNDQSTVFNKPVSIEVEVYRERKIEMMKNDFLIDLTPEEIRHIKTLKTEYTIDHYCREILHDRWG